MLGILSQKILSSLNAFPPSYIDASYVKWAEAGGAWLAPVIVDISSPEYYKQVIGRYIIAYNRIVMFLFCQVNDLTL